MEIKSNHLATQTGPKRKRKIRAEMGGNAHQFAMQSIGKADDHNEGPSIYSFSSMRSVQCEASITVLNDSRETDVFDFLKTNFFGIPEDPCNCS